MALTTGTDVFIYGNLYGRMGKSLPLRVPPDPGESRPSHQDAGAAQAKCVWPLLERSLLHSQRFLLHLQPVSDTKRKMSLYDSTYPHQILSNSIASGVSEDGPPAARCGPNPVLLLAPSGAAAEPSMGRMGSSTSPGHAKSMERAGVAPQLLNPHGVSRERCERMQS